MAKNTGRGYRQGAVRDRFQVFNPATGMSSISCKSNGKILRNMKSPGPAKGIRVRPFKRSGKF